MHTTDTSPARPSRPVAADYTGVDHAPLGAQLVAVDDTAAGIAGRIVWWRLTGDVSLAEIVDLMATIGADLSLAPPPPTPAAALANTLQTVGREVGATARPCGDGRWALVREQTATGRRQRVRWSSTGAGSPSTPPPAPTDDVNIAVEGLDSEAADEAAEPEDLTAPTVIADPGAPITHDTLAVVRLVAEAGGLRLHVKTLDEKLAAKLHESFAYFRDSLGTREASAWLTTVVGKSLDGVSLRHRGGVYYLPPESVARWALLVQALRATSGHRVSSVPAMTADDTAAAVLDALQLSADEFVDDTFDNLATLKRGAANTRITAAKELRAKVGRYEALFGAGRLAALRDRLDKLEAALATLNVMASV